MPIRGLRARAYHLNRVVYDNDFANSKWMRLMPAGHVLLENVLFAPLVINDASVGLIGIANKPGGFDENDARIAQMMGDIAATALECQQIRTAYEREQRTFQRITETSPVGIVRMDSEGMIVFGNPRAEEILGLEHAELTACRFDDPDFRITDLEGGVYPSEKLPFNQVMANGHSLFDTQLALQRRDRRVLLSINAAPLFDDQGRLESVVATLEDITTRKRTQEDLEKHRHRLDAILGSMSDTMHMVDEDLTITWSNSRLDDVFGPNMRGKKCYQAFRGRTQPCENCGVLLTFADGRERTTERCTKGPNGSERCFQISSRLVSTHVDGVRQVVQTGRDITEQKAAEQARREANRLHRQRRSTPSNQLYCSWIASNDCSCATERCVRSANSSASNPTRRTRRSSRFAPSYLTTFWRRANRCSKPARHARANTTSSTAELA